MEAKLDGALFELCVWFGDSSLCCLKNKDDEWSKRLTESQQLHMKSLVSLDVSD